MLFFVMTREKIGETIRKSRGEDFSLMREGKGSSLTEGVDFSMFGVGDIEDLSLTAPVAIF